MKIGDRIRQLRKERGLSGEQLAVKIGRGSQTLSHWECGHTSPRLEDIGDIAVALGIVDASGGPDFTKFMKGVRDKARGAA